MVCTGAKSLNRKSFGELKPEVYGNNVPLPLDVHFCRKISVILALAPFQTFTLLHMTTLNVLGTPLKPCSYDPLTGYFRDGCCETDASDTGSHLVCARMTQAFLEFSLERGNDLVTPRPQWRFAGLKAGDRWCLCVNRWKEALDAGLAPPVILECTHENATRVVSLELLELHAFKAAPH
jgi:uncharacterized protein (DUF2237 family)